jgi:hypothetical protein
MRTVSTTLGRAGTELRQVGRGLLGVAGQQHSLGRCMPMSVPHCSSLRSSCMCVAQLNIKYTELRNMEKPSTLM